MKRALLLAALAAAASSVRAQTIHPEPIEAPEAAVAGPTEADVFQEVDLLIGGKYYADVQINDLYHRFSGFLDAYKYPLTAPAKRAACRIVLEAISRPPERWSADFKPFISERARKRLGRIAAQVDVHRRQFVDNSMFNKLVPSIEAEFSKADAEARRAKPFIPLTQEQVQAEFERWNAAAFQGGEEGLATFSTWLQAAFRDPELGRQPAVRRAFQAFAGRAVERAPVGLATYAAVSQALIAHPKWAADAPGLGGYLIRGLNEIEHTAAVKGRLNEAFETFKHGLAGMIALAEARSPFFTNDLAAGMLPQIERLTEIFKRAAEASTATPMATKTSSPAPLAPVLAQPAAAAGRRRVVTRSQAALVLMASGWVGMGLGALASGDVRPLLLFGLLVGVIALLFGAEGLRGRWASSRVQPAKAVDPEVEKAFAELDIAYSANLEPEQLRARIEALGSSDPRYRVESLGAEEEEPDASVRRKQDSR